MGKKSKRTRAKEGIGRSRDGGERGGGGGDLGTFVAPTRRKIPNGFVPDCVAGCGNQNGERMMVKLTDGPAQAFCLDCGPDFMEALERSRYHGDEISAKAKATMPWCDHCEDGLKGFIPRCVTMPFIGYEPCGFCDLGLVCSSCATRTKCEICFAKICASCSDRNVAKLGRAATTRGNTLYRPCGRVLLTCDPCSEKFFMNPTLYKSVSDRISARLVDDICSSCGVSSKTVRTNEEKECLSCRSKSHGDPELSIEQLDLLEAYRQGLCGHCKKDTNHRGLEVKRCSGCKAVRYCDRRCQKLDWEKHKMCCGEMKQDRLERIAIWHARNDTVPVAS